MSTPRGEDAAALPFLDAGAVEAAAPMSAAVDALRAALRAERLPQQARSVSEVVAGQLLLMPAQSAAAVGVKLVTVAPANAAHGRPRIQGVYVLFDAATLAPELLLDGAALTSLRTPALSALTAQLLAVEGARELVVFGSGPQAWGHVLAMSAVRPIRRVRVVGRDPDRVAALVGRIRARVAAAEAAGPGAVAGADIVCTCTTSREPLFDGRLLPSHAHVVAIGAHEPTAREVDSETVRRAWVVVEDRATALRESGNIVIPLREGALDEQHLRADLAELVCGAAPDPRRLTLFTSVGMAWEDLAVATLLRERWRGR